MANIFTPGPPIAAGPYYIDREDCIGDSLAWINSNTNYLATNILQNTSNINNLQTQLTNATSPGTILQSQIVSQVLGTIASPAALTDVAGMPVISINNRKQNISKILIELTGGRYSAPSTAGFSTFFYVRENNNPWISLPYPAEHVFVSSATVQAPHNAKYVYTPGSTITSISTKVVIIRRGSTANSWNLANTEAIVPFVFSITEIKS